MRPLQDRMQHAASKGAVSGERQKILGAVADRPGIFLTEPEFVLDCMERMGDPAKDFLKRKYERERNKTGKEILKLLLNAAAGKGKEIPRNGVDSYRERKELERRRKEEERRKDRELFRLVLTEIPERVRGRTIIHLRLLPNIISA